MFLSLASPPKVRAGEVAKFDANWQADEMLNYAREKQRLVRGREKRQHLCRRLVLKAAEGKTSYKLFELECKGNDYEKKVELWSHSHMICLVLAVRYIFGRYASSVVTCLMHDGDGRSVIRRQSHSMFGACWRRHAHLR